MQIIAALLLLFYSQPTDTIDLEITFISTEEEGDIRIAWYDQQQTFMKRALGFASETYRNGETTIIISVPNKPIAITCYHDVNRNEELDTNWIGIPTEPYGFSNDARGAIGPPSFEECMIDPSTVNRITIHLK